MSLTRIAYAPSFGGAIVPDEFRLRLAEWLEEFDSISVRESSGVDIINDTLGKAVPQVLDPVFLLSSKDWNEIVQKPSFNGNYIAFYFLEVSKSLSNLVKTVSRKLRLPVVVLGKGGGFVLTCKTIMAIDSGPSEFLGWIKNATFVITNSFHSTAFSIIFQRPFYTVPHSTRNARLESILELTKLIDRQVKDTDEIREREADLLMSLDFGTAQSLLQVEVKKSLGYLKDALS